MPSEYELWQAIARAPSIKKCLNICFLFAFSLLPVLALSQSLEHTAAAKQVVRALQPNENFLKTMDVALQRYYDTQWRRIAGAAMDDLAEPLEIETRLKIFDKIEADMANIRRKMLSDEFYEDVQYAAIRFYAANFSLVELGEIAAHYRAPIGKKVLKANIPLGKYLNSSSSLEGFSDAELGELRTFYWSPAGQKILKFNVQEMNAYTLPLAKWFPVWDEQLRQEVLNLLKVSK